MPCPNENTLARLLDATLSDAERTSIEQHLDACSDCSNLVEELVWQVAPEPGRYRMHAEIARGGMGRVVEASDPLLGRVVAVKEALSDDIEVLRRFARETHITARLEHPSIVPVYDAGTTPDGTPYYVMRKVSGKPLAELVEQATSVDDRLALVPHVVAAAHAIAHAHQRGIVHRDLKPTNILVGNNGETVVIDWGLAKAIGDLDDRTGAAPDPGGSLRTRFGTVFGTPGFMAPEQIRGEEVDTRGDVYALGATLYYVLARQPPHASGSEDDMMAAAAAGPPTPIATHVAGVPPELSAIIDKALAFDDRARYPDAAALADDLQRFLTGQLISAHRYSRRERLARFIKRNRVSVAIAMVAVIALAVGGWFAIRRVVSERDRADRQATLATDHAREAEQRADDLIVLQAETLAKSDPTLAVALVKQLRSPPERWQRMWRSARDVAAGARSQGVAHAMPGPTKLFSLSMSRSGKRAAATDTDGVIWVYDLPRHGARRLDAASPRHAVEFIDDDHLLAFQADHATAIDLSTGAQRGFADLAAVSQVAVTASAIFWSSQHVIHRTELATGTTVTIANARENPFSVSPDQHWLALIGERQVTVVDTTSLATHALGSTIQPELVAWAGDSVQLAITGAGRVGTAARQDAAIAWHGATPTTPLPLFPVFAGNVLYIGSGSLAIFDRDELSPVVDSIELGVGVTVGFESYAIVATNGVLHANGNGRTVVLKPPAAAIRTIASVPGGPYVIAAGTGRVFMWDLRDVLPSPQSIDNPIWSSTVGDHDLLVWDRVRFGSWIEIDTGRSTRIDDIPPARVTASTRDRAVAIAVTQVPTAAFFVTKNRAEWLDADVVAARLREPDEVMFGTRHGAVVLLDSKEHRRITVLHRDAQIDSIGDQGPWIAAAYAPDLVVRRNVVTGVESELHVGAHVQPALDIDVLADGRVCFPIDARVACWKTDGTLVTAFALPAAASIAGLGPERMVLATASSVYVADFAHGHLSAALPADSPFSISADAELAVVAGAYGEIDAVDLTTGRRWQVIQGGPVKIQAVLSPDGTTVFGHADADIGQAISMWTIALPQNPNSTAQWLDQLTNATAEGGAAALAFP